MKKLPEELIEEGFSQVDLRVDKENAKIDGALFHSSSSKNGYDYSDQAMQDLAELYVGAPIFANHLKPGVENLLGSAVDAKVESSNGKKVIRGQSEWDPNSPLYESIMDHAEKRPHLIRFSHEVPKGKFKMRRRPGKRPLVERVYAVRKLSLIAEPGGVNKGLFERDDQVMTSAKELRAEYPEIIESIEREAVNGCDCHSKDGVRSKLIDLQVKLDTANGELLEKDKEIEKLKNEIQLEDRRAQILERCEKKGKRITDSLLEMLLEARGEDKELAEKYDEVIDSLPDVSDEEETTKKFKKRRVQDGGSSGNNSGKNRFAKLWSS